MKWVNIIGLVLQFLAFWLAAPELLGENTLKRFEKGLTKLITRIPVIVLLIIIAVYFGVFAIGGLIKGLKGAQAGMDEMEMYTFFIQMGIATLAYMIYIFNYKRVNRWLENKVAVPLTNKLINNNETRKKSLIIGALLFTIGFLCQFMVAIMA